MPVYSGNQGKQRLLLNKKKRWETKYSNTMQIRTGQYIEGLQYIADAGNKEKE